MRKSLGLYVLVISMLALSLVRCSVKEDVPASSEEYTVNETKDTTEAAAANEAQATEATAVEEYTTAQETTSQANETDENKIYVESEFAPLKKVVVAKSDLVAPTDTSMLGFLPKETIERATSLGTLLSVGDPEKQKKWEQERLDLIAVLEKYGVEILRPRDLTEYEIESGKEHGVGNMFVRDPFFTIGPYVIEGSIRLQHRTNEVLPVRDILTSQVYGTNAIYVAVPRADTSAGPNSDAGPFLEGGDVIVYNKNVFVGNSGRASNTAGVQWLKQLLEPQGYTVTEVKLTPDVLHLDCAMSLVREGLMIVSEEAFVDGVPEIFDGWDKIKVDPEQIKYLALNGLPIDDKTYITDYMFKDTIGGELEKRGITVEYVHFDISRSYGGSFRCSTQPLLRAW
ncbi:MAG: arginine deiminase family protein [Eubacteriales bacterium]|nr:arginine deiminase family protein [Eubacteriales bacterium]